LIVPPPAKEGSLSQRSALNLKTAVEVGEVRRKGLVGLGKGLFEGCLEVHPAGKREAEKSLAVDTHGRRIHVEWDPASPVTPLGQLVFVGQFVATGGLLYHWVERYPPRFSSPNAPTLTNLLGTITLSVLAGQFRDAHITGLPADTVNPVGLGMNSVQRGQRAASLCRSRRQILCGLAARGFAEDLVTGPTSPLGVGLGCDGQADLRPSSKRTGCPRFQGHPVSKTN
jgi:hypothetical protein